MFFTKILVSMFMAFVYYFNSNRIIVQIIVLFPFRFIISFITVKLIIKKINPVAIIGTGGYASGIPLLASINTKIKTLIHEQNSYPGITTVGLRFASTNIQLSIEQLVVLP